MATVHNQVWNQYLSIVKTEKSMIRQAAVPSSRDRVERLSDAPASKTGHPTKGKYIDLVV